jgi:hypothetical protein
MLVLLDVLQSFERNLIRGQSTDILPLEENGSLVLLQESADGPEKSGLSCTISTDHNNDLSGADFDGNIEEYMQLLVRDVEILNFQNSVIFCHSRYLYPFFKSAFQFPVTSPDLRVVEGGLAFTAADHLSFMHHGQAVHKIFKL